MGKSAIEQLLRKELRARRIDPRQPLLLLGDDRVETRVAYKLLQKILPQQQIVLARAGENILTATTLERELARKLRAFLDDTDEAISESLMMTTIPEKLILNFAERNGLQGVLPEHDEVTQLIEELQQEQSQTKACLKKSFAHLESAVKK